MDIRTRTTTDINRTRNRRILAVALGFMALLLVVACGTDEKDEPVAPAAAPAQVAPTTAPAPTSTPRPTAAPTPTATTVPTVAPAPTATSVPVIEPTATSEPVAVIDPVADAIAAEKLNVAPKSDSVRPADRSAELTADEEALLVAFATHWDAAIAGDWQTFLDGCTAANRAQQTPTSVGEKFGAIFRAAKLTLDGFEIVNRSATVLSPITAFVEANVSQNGEIIEGYQDSSWAWLWTTEDGVWVDGVCSLGGY